MTTSDQKPIGSGFGAKSTASEVMKGIDLTGKTAIVTGGYSGIGLETTKALVAAGAEVTVPVRNMEKADQNFQEAGIVVNSIPMDLGDLVSVQNFASEFSGNHDKLHFLINNAGIMACPETRVGSGWEAQFATNHIGHFLLTNELAAYLKNAGGARVICLSSLAHKRSQIRFEDIHFTNGEYEKWEAYGQSKTANALFARALNRRGAKDGVKAFSVHPGGIMTPLQRHLEQEEMIAMGWIDENGEMPDAVKAIFKTPEQGCSTTLWCATSSTLETRGGEYCEDCDISELVGDDAPRFTGVMPWACDDEAADKLWDVTERMIAEA